MLSDLLTADVSDLCAQAGRLRDQGKGKTISYSLNVFLPLTRLCRNRCGYCDYRVEPLKREPEERDSLFLSPEEILATARAAQDAGCTEALFVTGDKPERRYPDEGRWLRERHLDSTPHYAFEMARLILSHTRLYPHTNAGVMTPAELKALKQVNASIGLMLETTADRLCRPGYPHAHSPDKLPQVRLDFLRQAGKLHIPTTTGLLIGIGETRSERLQAILEIRRIQEEYGHIQEVIIQNFKPKQGTAMAKMSGPPLSEILWTCAAARLLLGPEMNIQVAPNLVPGGSGAFGRCLAAGINDWGGISPLTPDFVNRESRWPAVTELKEKTEQHGFILRRRFPVYPEFIRRKSRFLSRCIYEKLNQDADSEGYVYEGVLSA